MPKNAVVFDFDGVIALSEPVHMRAWEDVASEFGRALPPMFLEEGVGSSDEKLAISLANFWEQKDSSDVLRAKRKYYQHRCVTETALVPGLLEFLDHIQGKLPIGVATSSSLGDVKPVMDRHQMQPRFDSILTIESVKNPKPDPEIYLKSADRLEVAPEDCWVFEDSIHGVTAARAAGCRVIALSTTFLPEDLLPHHACIENYTDARALLSLLNLSENL